MKGVSLKQLADWSGGALIQGTPSEMVCGVSTDSRLIEESNLFVALKGDRFDAHDFLDQVTSSKASGMLVSALPKQSEDYEGGIVLVRDTLDALQRIARSYRRSCGGLTVVGVTGSNGKTSTKDFLGSVLSRAGKVSKTRGNLNNHIGVPLTALSAESDDRFGVWEMGMNHAGEIEVLAEIALPDVAVVTNIGTAHLEHLKTRDAIAEEKSQLPRAISGAGYCVMPSTDDYYGFVSGVVDCEMVPTGGTQGVVRAEKLQYLPDGRTVFMLTSDFGTDAEVCLSVRGAHMVENALLAAAIGFKEGLSAETIAEALLDTKLTSGRLEESELHGITILDDSYNANPDSMKAAIRTMASADITGRRIAVLGFMGELGEIEQAAHRDIGAYLVENEIDILITVGEQARLIGEGAEGIGENANFTEHGEAASHLKEAAKAGDMVLFKGSRAADMGRVLEAFESM